MFKNNQDQYEKLQKAVKKNWPEITDEEFSRTNGDLQAVLNLVSEREEEAPDLVLKKIRESITQHDLDIPFKDTPSGVGDPRAPESKEWKARESHNE